jgi:hypothetical protein
MNCEDVVRDLPLYQYGELDPAAEENLEQHLHTCASCQHEWERQRALSQALHRRELDPPADLLAECRMALARSLDHEAVVGAAPEARHSWLPFRDTFRAIFGPHLRPAQVLAGAGLLALGFLSGRINAPFAGGGSLAGLVPDGMVSRVRSVQPDTSGRVQIAVDETRQRTVSGRFDDPAIQQLLLSAAREEDNPGLRVESVDLLKGQCGGSVEIRGALVEAIENDPNPGVRLKALEGLKSLASDAAIKKTLAQVLLKDSNAGVRIQVIDLLMTHRDESMVGVLQTVVDREENSYVRMRCRKALQEMNASVGTF